MFSHPHITHVPLSYMRALARLHWSRYCERPEGEWSCRWSLGLCVTHTPSPEIRLLRNAWCGYITYMSLAVCLIWKWVFKTGQGLLLCNRFRNSQRKVKKQTKKEQQQQELGWDSVSGVGWGQGGSRLTDYVEESFTFISILDCQTTLFFF